MTQRLPYGPNSFAHLHVHSEFSLLDGLSRVDEMTKRVADQGMTAMALTDHGSMYGVIPFYALAKDDVGYHNLLALTTAAHLDGYYC